MKRKLNLTLDKLECESVALGELLDKATAILNPGPNGTLANKPAWIARVLLKGALKAVIEDGELAVPVKVTLGGRRFRHERN